MIKTAITLVRLRWTLTLATLRKSAWQTVAYVFSAVLAAGTIIGTGVLAQRLAIGAEQVGGQAAQQHALIGATLVIAGIAIRLLRNPAERGAVEGQQPPEE